MERSDLNMDGRVVAIAYITWEIHEEQIAARLRDSAMAAVVISVAHEIIKIN